MAKRTMGEPSVFCKRCKRKISEYLMERHLSSFHPNDWRKVQKFMRELLEVKKHEG